ncbi:phosphoglycerate mutase-like protein [Macrolepiota fuliginosa MF-IS2]|uniref:Phosphoglycerate mutase-like protein n=1 Tax=Macrolepiota fuliginosa MF-IS2 TaxID=1400762 RepID=A0A9P5X9W0_9AGAR|nr:phosphoglycerate mutase-like protein [Macrolepiota fuliginosa MF-IS2]
MGLTSAHGSHKEINGEPGSYTYRPPQAPLDVEGYPAAPAGLELEQVHVFVRHGERSPVGIRLADPPANIPSHWNLCKIARRFQAVAAEGTNNPGARMGWDGSPSTRKLIEWKDGTVMDNECLLGELTDIGRQSTYNYGVALRKLYVDRLGFIPDTLKDVHNVYFRSTNMPRTVESLQQIMYGLYPNGKCLEHAYPPLLIRNGRDENLIGNTYSCKRLEILQISFAKAAAEAYNPMLGHLDKKVSKYINGNPIRVDGRPRASGIMDTIRASIAHGIRVPPEFEDKGVVDLIEQAVVQEWFADKTEEVRRLAMGRLLEDLTDKMHRKIEKGEKDPLKFLVHSTHDTAIAGLCSTLDVFDEKWPAFTASITFELFKRQMKPESQQQGQTQSLLTKLGAGTPPVEYYVRVRHQNKNMHLPLCAEKGKHLEGAPEFCTFKAFRERMKELIPEDWDAECVPTGWP